MCITTTTNYSCAHTNKDTFPCNEYLDNPTDRCPSEVTSSPKNAPYPCLTCINASKQDQEDAALLASALERINTDPSLAAHRPLRETQSRAKTREYFEKCGHFARLTLRGWPREPGEPEWIDLAMGGSCYECCSASNWLVEDMKRRGIWDKKTRLGEADVVDPWGELDQCWDDAKRTWVDVGDDGSVEGEMDLGVLSVTSGAGEVDGGEYSLMGGGVDRSGGHDSPGEGVPATDYMLDIDSSSAKNKSMARVPRGLGRRGSDSDEASLYSQSSDHSQNGKSRSQDSHVPRDDEVIEPHIYYSHKPIPRMYPDAAPEGENEEALDREVQITEEQRSRLRIPAGVKVTVGMLRRFGERESERGSGR